MKNIIRIFTRDMKKIFTNWVATIVVLALMIIPSLYSLINIKASWDPYGNTSGLKVAIVNEDKGTIYKEQDINLGEELVDELKDNDSLGWTFVDKETAANGLLMEKYYATIEIPESFSEDVTTVAGKNVTKPKLIYTVNEKKNAIAPKITDTGVKTVKGQVDENIIKTVSGIIFKLCNETGIDIEDNRPQLRRIMDSVYKLDDNMPEIGTLIDSAIDGTISVSDLLVEINKTIPTISDTLDATDSFLQDSQEFLDQTQGDLSDLAPDIKDKLVTSENTLDTASIALANLDETILPEVAKKTLITASDTAKATSITIRDAKSKLKDMKKFVDKMANIELPKPKSDDVTKTPEELSTLNEKAKKEEKSLKDMKRNLKDLSKTLSSIIDRLNTIDEQLDIVIDRVDEEVSKLDNGKTLEIQSLTDTRKILDDTHNLVSDMVDSFDSEFVPAIKSGFDSIREISDNGLTLIEQGKSTLPDVERLLGTFQNVSSISNDQLLKVQERFPDMKEKVHNLAEKFREIDDKDKIDEVLELITNNWEDQSTFLSSPVEIQDNRLFSWPNYGSTATPFYTVLCLWIGAYMLSILLGTEAPPLEEGEEIKPYETYFGKMLLFLFIGIGQAIIASTGALFILGSYAVHPVMFVFYTIFVGIIFMIIIYTAVSVFGNAGIIFGVVLLVIQVAGTGGNFPIQVNPEFFKTLFPFLPFTYALNGMRQVMAGIVYSILFKDIAILCVYGIISIIIGVLFKKVVNEKSEKFGKRLEDSSIMNG